MLSVYTVVWVLTLGMGVGFLWIARMIAKGQLKNGLKGAEVLASSERVAYSRDFAAVCGLAGVWYLAVAIGVIVLRLDRYAWLALFGVGSVIVVFGFRWAAKRHGIKSA